MAFWSQDKYIKALRYAAEAHKGQPFPGTNLPYLLHISLVSMEVMTAISIDQNKLDGDLAVQTFLGSTFLGSDQAKCTPVKGLDQKRAVFLTLKRCFWG